MLGLAGVIATGGVPIAASALRFDFPVMIAVAIACLPVFFTGYRVARWEGAVFLGYYIAYMVYIILEAGEGAALFGKAMVWFVIPLTLVTLVVVSYRAIRERREARV